MNERIAKILDRLKKREYRSLRSDFSFDDTEKYEKENLPLPLRASDRLMKMAKNEKAIVFEEDQIGFMRTIKKVPDILTQKERDELSKTYLLFDNAQVCNISSDYEYTLNVGFNKRLEEVREKLKEKNTEKETIELKAMEESILAVFEIVNKYQKEAERVGNKVLAEALKKIPFEGATSYYEACLFFRIMNYMLWLNANKHNTVGRFDQYMYKFYKHDKDLGLISDGDALNITEELFIDLNFDADLYPGVQQGDNGQSLVLGGIKKDGSDAYNELTEICLKASLELKLIDPKINLRVNKNTDFKWYKLGTELTKVGLGFPQYSNDDVVIPALVKLGYEESDARDYVVAACWEFIIPKVGMDIPNVDALSFPMTVGKVVHSKEFLKAKTYEEIEALVDKEIEKEVHRLVELTKNIFSIPSPFQSILMSGCVENKKDIADGGKYNNFGLHGAGLSTAADSLAAIKKCIFEDKVMSKEELVKALESNFEGYEKERKELISAPKMGNNDDFVDTIACHLLDRFSIECAKYKNTRGGIYRAGTGTAMYYIWYSENLGATSDGRKAEEPFSANYSPSLSRNFEGVLSVIKSFTKPDLTKTCNGGPLTLEFHDTLFRNEEGIDKVAALVRTFVLLGGHQLQLNAVNRDVLLDAQKHPEDHKNLIVRVWGWSGYFNELDLAYQNHIIKRLEFLN